MTWSASTDAPRSCASLTAVAIISSPIRPSFIGTRMLEKLRLGQRLLVGRVDPLEQALAAPAPDERRRRRARGEPERARVARARVRDQRDHEDGERQHGADDRRQRDVGAARRGPSSGTRYGPRELGLGEAKPDHGELRGGEREQDAEAEEAREERDRRRSTSEVAEQERDRDQRRGDDRLAARRASAGRAGRTRAAAARARRASTRAAPKPEIEVVIAASRISARRCRRRRAARRASPDGSGRASASTMPSSGALQPVVAELGRAVLRRERRQRRRARSRRRARRRARSRRRGSRGRSTARARAPPRRGWRPSRARCRRASRAAARRRASCQRGLEPSVDPCVSASRREEEREPEHDEQSLRDEVEHGDDDPEPVEAPGAGRAGTPRRPRSTATPTTTSHGSWRERVDLERPAEVVRQEERRERDHDQVVEEEHPAGQEAGEVVERVADEGRRAAGLRDRRRALRVRERDDAGRAAPTSEQHVRREPERVQAMIPSAK